MVIHSSFKDFILFLYVHMSQADENYDPNEMATIKKKAHQLFQKETDIEKKFMLLFVNTIHLINLNWLNCLKIPLNTLARIPVF